MPPWPWIALVLACALVYLWGLGSFYAPTNGDEMVYIHIARMTAESGHWLPLQSEIVDTRNTKPPLLFWQAMVAGQWGHQWSIFALRLPSIAYTFATAALVAFFSYRIRSSLRTACLAAALYLLFFSTFRYGRVYLTSAPETFWLTLPLWWVLWRRLGPEGKGQGKPLSLNLGPAAYTLFGICMGLGCAYKSFALAAPAAAGLWCAILLSEPQRNWQVLLRTTLGLAWSTALAVGIFGLWFAMDPDPAAVWQEFVVAENAGKMSGQQGYWHAALFGAYPMWTQLLAYPENAGLLFFSVLGLLWLGLRQAFKVSTYREMPPWLMVLLAWLVLWLVIFTIPSQRSARYVIPAMPALAIVAALVWDKVARPWHWISLAIAVPILIMLGRIAWTMGEMNIASSLEVTMVLIAAAAGLAGAVAGFVYKQWLSQTTLLTCLAVYAGFGLMVQPLTADTAQYSAAGAPHLQGKHLGVPNGFTGQFERFNYIFPNARRTPYDAEGRKTGAFKPELPSAERLDYLLAELDAVVWLPQEASDTTPSCAPGCRIAAQRWHVRSRHKSGEITLNNLWYPQQWLFGREWLLVKTLP
jgi:4-amino-4-deoxy-L-arabinose transferase-like glycosyltransferase